jgi:hypothetical protein
MDRRRTGWILTWTAAAAAVVGLLSRELPPQGFSSGDPGIKLIAARQAIAHPGRPFQIDLPAIGGRAAPFVDPLFKVHGGHAHALQSPLFPLLSAPPIAWLGLRGAYLLPGLAFLCLMPLAAGIARRSGAPAGVHALAIAAVLASPVFFYAFEIWDHVPAVAVLAGATLLAFGDVDGPGARRRSIAAGLAAAIAVLLRPEAVWYAAALGLSLRAPRAIGAYAAGGALVMVPFMAANALEGGPLAGHHAAANLAAMSDRWLAVRGHRLLLWLLPLTPPMLGALIGCAAAWSDRLLGGNVRRAQALGLLAAAAIAVAAAAGGFGADALWTAWPLGAVVLVPGVDRAGRGRLAWLALWSTAGIWLSSTHDGGAQWGPRFLLIAAPAFIVLAAAALQDAVSPGDWRRVRIALVAVIVLAGVWTSRRVHLELRGVKRYHARLVAALDRHTTPGGYVVTNVPWLDQLAAPLHGTRTWLVAAPPADPAEVLRQLERSGVGTIDVAWSADPREPGPIPLDGSCFRFGEVAAIPERAIRIATATCASSPGR